MPSSSVTTPSFRGPFYDALEPFDELVGVAIRRLDVKPDEGLGIGGPDEDGIIFGGDLKAVGGVGLKGREVAL